MSCWVRRGPASERRADLTAVVATDDQFCSLDGAGALSCWTVGARALEEVEFPELATELVEIVAGDQHFCARDRAGQVTCWGDESYAQLGASRRPLLLPDEPTQIPQ